MCVRACVCRINDVATLTYIVHREFSLDDWNDPVTTINNYFIFPFEMEIFRRSKHHTGGHLHFAFSYELPRSILNVNYIFRFFFQSVIYIEFY